MSETQTKSPSIPPSGLLVIDKPRGMSSHAVVQKIRRLYHLKRVGHAGTLDPEATGVMVVALGKATRLLEYYVDQTKAYIADLELGKTSVTGDVEGPITTVFEPNESRPWPTKEQITALLQQEFIGEIQQVPPMYSALKQDGEPLYKKARRGELVDIPSRTITIFSLDLLSYDPPFLQLDVVCSKGTYIRTLAEDVGAALETGAYLTALCRRASGQFSLEQSVTLEVLENMSESERLQHLLPWGFGLQDIPSVEVTEADLMEIQDGRDISLPQSANEKAFTSTSTGNQELLAWKDGQLVAVLEFRQDHLWKPRKVFLS